MHIRARRITTGLTLAVAALTAIPLPARAQFTTYTSRAAFQTAVGPVQTETFGQPLQIVPTAGGTFATSFGSLVFDGNGSFRTFGDGDVFAEAVTSGTFGPQFLQFNFATPVTSFGADFTQFDLPGITLSAFIGASSFTIAEGFFGVRSTTAFNSLVIGNASDNTFYSLDNVSVGAAVSTVPEPSTVVLLLVGLGGIGFAARRTRRTRRLAGATATAALLATGACADNPTRAVTGTDLGEAAAAVALPTCDGNNGDITVPAGFCATVVADNVGTARHITVASNGDTYVAINGQTGGGVLALRDTDGDGRADVQQTFGAPGANGIAVFRNWLYVAYRNEVVRYRLDRTTLVPTAAAEVVVSGLAVGGDHQSKNITFDGRSLMYVNLGSASNSCQESNRATGSPGVDPCPELSVRAGIWRFDALALNQTLANGTHFGVGFRNTEALRYDVGRSALYGIPHGRDELHEDWPAFFTEQEQADLPAEEFHRIELGDDAGWPYCFYDGIRNLKVLAPEYGGDGDVIGPRCTNKKQPIADYPGHWAPNDVMFYYGAQFPTRYRGGAFIAFHGGHDRSPLPNEGFLVAFVPFNGNVPSQTFETFANGFTGGGSPLPGAAVHRPMGLAEGPDGSLYVTDDKGGRIWRISYRGAVAQ